jgi:hypothetical protein
MVALADATPLKKTDEFSTGQRLAGVGPNGMPVKVIAKS